MMIEYRTGDPPEVYQTHYSGCRNIDGETFCLYCGNQIFGKEDWVEHFDTELYCISFGAKIKRVIKVEQE